MNFDQKEQQTRSTMKVGIMRICGCLTRLSAGQAATEMAFLIPVLALLLVAITDFGRVYSMSVAVNNAARSGVEYGAQDAINSQDIAGMQKVSMNDMSGIAGASATAQNFCECPGSSARFACPQQQACKGQLAYVQVQTAASFKTILSYPGVPSPVTINATAIMRSK